MLAHDIHSYSNPELVRVRHLNLNLSVIFEQQTIQGTAILSIEQYGRDARQLILDSRSLQIDETEVSPDGVKYREARFSTGKSDRVLGAPLRIDIAPDTRFVRIRYSTDPVASALQWLTPEQTTGKRRPFLYTQSQAIHARSWIPLQDSPGVRVTFEARVHVPAGMKAVMGAKTEGNCSANADPGGCRFIMDKAIPPYLIALAAGDLAFQSTGARTGVWAEPAVVGNAAAEFSDMEKMLEAAERLYGPYRWDRYDVLVMPPSFPFGGMENPMLTFATPTVIAGDKSLVSLVAHEMAHSWSGNLVTNATWSDFWLNEGYTVYIERRILEQLYGKRRADMEAALGYGELLDELKSHPPADQVLHVDLAGRDPDEGATQIPYEKGSLFLRQIEAAFGRERFDAYLRDYFDHFAFQSITTAQSMAYMKSHLFEAGAQEPRPDIKAWISGTSLPAGAIVPSSEAFHAVDLAAREWMQGKKIDTTEWSTQEWMRFLRELPQTLSAAEMRRLDSDHHFTESGNNEILAQWLFLAARNGYEPAYARIENFLATVGRRKYVRPLYEALDRERATDIYAKARPMYHPITQATIDAVIAAKK
ncbi:MAG: M1 family metallopeptidase [Acidobacteriota bacterium]|nr:M1 family metallopeptidase [Acidobacteriota bacterium]